MTTESNKIIYTPTGGGVAIFTISGVNTGTNLDLPNVADGKTVTINKLNDAVDNATIQAYGDGLNITANFAATVKTGNITNITVNGKTYTVTGYYIYDGERYYSNRGNPDLLNLEASAITNIAVTGGVINFPA